MTLVPLAAKRPCAWRGFPPCAGVTRERFCDKHRATERKRQDALRPSSSARGYDSRWRRLRWAFLRAHPICVDPFGLHRHRITPATEVDHIKPHKGNKALFWNQDNWQPVCHACHSRKTASEDGGFGRLLRFPGAP